MRWIALGFLTVIFNCAAAQQMLHTVTLSDTVAATAIDRPGDLYVVLQSGEIKKFSPDGELILSHSADTPATLFDPRDGARLFLYHRDSQRYEFRNTSFKPLVFRELDPAFAIEPWLVCPSGEYKLWILDRADKTLKKVDTRSSKMEVDVVLDPDLIDDVTHIKTIREYQGFVFLSNADKRIEVFNTLGIHLRTLEAPGIRSFNFFGEDLYYLSGNNIVFFNLFTAETDTREVLPGYQAALIGEDRVVLFTATRMDIFSFSPH